MELRNNVIKMIQYNVVGGKMIRGLFSVYSAYVSCSKWDDSLKEQYYLQKAYYVEHLLLDGVLKYYKLDF